MTTLVSMNLILDSKELFDAFYNVLTNNCQQTVSGLLSCLSEHSLNLKFQVPGSNDKVAINDDKIVDFVEQLYPNWAAGKHQGFPEIPDPFAFIVKEQQDLQAIELQYRMESKYSEYLQLIFKQRVINALNQFMQETCLKGRKAVFSKLDQSSFNDALRKTQHKAMSAIEQIKTFWKTALDIVVVLDFLGVVILHFAFDSQNKDHTKEVEHKMELASKIEDFTHKSVSSIHAVIISAGKGSLGRVKKTKFGNMMNLTVDGDRTEGDIMPYICACFHILIGALTPKKCLQA